MARCRERLAWCKGCGRQTEPDIADQGSARWRRRCCQLAAAARVFSCPAVAMWLPARATLSVLCRKLLKSWRTRHDSNVRPLPSEGNKQKLRRLAEVCGDRQTGVFPRSLWLSDLVAALGEGRRKPPPDKKTLSYLIVLDLAAIFERVTCARPTRRIDPDTSKPYGPFWDFVTAVCRSLPQVGSPDRAIRDVQTYSATEFSPFIANLQFRDPALWQKLR
jgi:hypothetical protein